MVEINNLQKEIDENISNSLIKLFPKEYEGPINISKPFTIEGNGATLWSKKGPVLIIQSPGVILKNLKVEVTCEQEDKDGKCAILLKKGGVIFENIELKGLISGLTEEEGEWFYPSSIELGEIAPGKKSFFSIKIIVPVSCEIISNISGLELHPNRLNPGENNITITIEELLKDTLINGNIYLNTSRFKRKITVCGYVAGKAPVKSGNKFLWTHNLRKAILEINNKPPGEILLTADEEIYYEKLKELLADKTLERNGQEELNDLLEVISITPEKAKALEEMVKKELGIISDNTEFAKYERLVENFSTKGIIESNKREILFKKARESGMDIETAIEIEMKVYIEKGNKLRNNRKYQESLVFLDACKYLGEEIERLKKEKRFEKKSRENIEEEKKKWIEPEMVYINGGTFEMGNNNGRNNEKPAHNVTVSSFYMGKYEVTNREFSLFDSSHKNWGDDLPVVEVNWKDAVNYCKWLIEKTGKNYRLPTEAEWEYACRGGTVTEYYWGDEVDDSYCWYCDNSGEKVHPVGQKRPNKFGLYDMSGNLWEWCSDWYGNYPGGNETNSGGPKSGSSRVLRGGSWKAVAHNCRSAYRFNNYPDYHFNYYGFRLALTL